MSLPEPRTALVLEDLPSARAMLVTTLQAAFPGIEVATAETLADARRAVAELVPEIALIDIGLPDGSGVDLIAELACPCVVTTIFDDDVHLFPALRAGASGYLLKDQPQDKLVDALRGILAGEPPLSPPIARRLLRVFRPEPASDVALAPRETECLALIAKGLTAPEVARHLGVSSHTVAGYVKSIYRKLNISSRAEATIEAVRRGLADARI